MQKFLMHINGKDVPSESGEWLDSINPYSQENWAQIPKGNAEDAKNAIDAAHKAFEEGEWRKLHASERGALLRKFADLLAEKAEYLAKLDVADNGKLYAEMLGQAKYLPKIYHYYAGFADKIEGSFQELDKPQMYGIKQYEPYGVCVAITAWNSPLLLASMKLAPALAAGNTVVIKPSEHASISTLEFVRLFQEAGFLPGVVNAVSGLGPEIGSHLVEHPKVAKISFTGGVVGGQKVYEKAAQGYKAITLELGGKSPQLVFADADLDNAAKGVVSGIFAGTGQSCIAGSRLLIDAKIHDEFVEKLIAIAKEAKMGDPMESSTLLAPMATKPQFQKVLDYIENAKSEGAKCVYGGNKKEGWFIEPTIFTEVKNTMRIAQEEVFGPVLSVIKFHDEEEAIQLANDTEFGLAAGIWTQDPRKIFELPKKIRAGTVWVNTYRALSYLMPFGGYKHSGLGRENGRDVLYSYMQPKSVWVSTNPEVPNPFKMRL